MHRRHASVTLARNKDKHPSSLVLSPLSFAFHPGLQPSFIANDTTSFSYATIPSRCKSAAFLNIEIKYLGQALIRVSHSINRFNPTFDPATFYN